MSTIQIRPVELRDDILIGRIIRQVLTEYGLNREGFAFMDAELDQMSAQYTAPRAGYYIAELGGQIVGGAGFAPLRGADAETAELRKMYLLPEARGLGIGSRLMRTLLRLARDASYRTLYLETDPAMRDAIRLYRQFGFQPLERPMGNSGHFACECYFRLDLRASPAGERAETSQ